MYQAKGDVADPTYYIYSASVEQSSRYSHVRSFENLDLRDYKT